MTEPCKICKQGVTIIIRRDGGLPTVDATGYSGITDDGDAVCRGHFCPVCGDAHETAEQFEDCEFYGPPRVDLTICGVSDPYKVLAAYHS